MYGLTACGDGGSAILTPDNDDDDSPSSTCIASTCGEVRLALTDADGNLLSYAGNVNSTRLEDSNGDDVEVLDDEQRVDFAELAGVSEFVLTEDFPNGTYERAVVRLDFSDAEISVEVDGFPTPPSTSRPRTT